ncbi:MAG: hypothetical protein WB239_10595 [Acidimicrobiia bacterium]
MAQTGLETVFELYEFACDLVAARYLREHPDAEASDVAAAVRAWARDQSRAPHGDSDGVPVSLPLSR